MVQVIATSTDYMVSATPDLETFSTTTISDPGGGAFPNHRIYHLPAPNVVGLTNMQVFFEVESADNATRWRGLLQWNGPSDPNWPSPQDGGNPWFDNRFSFIGPAIPQFTGVVAIDPNIGESGYAHEVLVNAWGQDPAQYPFGDPAVGAGNHVIVENHSEQPNTVTYYMQGQQRGKVLTMPIPATALVGDRIVVIFLSQQPGGGDDQSSTIVAPIPPLSYVKPSGNDAPFISKTWLSDYTHNHDFTGQYPRDLNNYPFPVDEDGTGNFVCRPGVLRFYQDPVTGQLLSKRDPGDQQTEHFGYWYSRWQGESTAALNGSSIASTIMVGSTILTVPLKPEGTPPEEPDPPPPTEYRFFIDGGKVNYDFLHFSAVMLVLRNEPGSELYGAPYRRDDTVELGDQFGSDLSITRNAGPNNADILPPELSIQPAHPTDLIVTAFTYQGKIEWGNPLGDTSFHYESSPSTVRFFRTGQSGYFPDGEPPGTTPGYISGDAWYTTEPARTIWLSDFRLPGFDDSGWETGISDVIEDYYTDDFPIIRPNPPSVANWYHYAFEMYEVFYFREEFDIPDPPAGSYFAGGLVRQVGGHTIGATWANGYYGWFLGFGMPSSRWSPPFHVNYAPLSGIDDHFADAYGFQRSSSYYFRNRGGIWYSLNYHGTGWHWVPVPNGGPYCISGYIYAWRQPWDDVGDGGGINHGIPAGIHHTVDLRWTQFDGTAVSGLRDTSSTSPLDPPLINVVREREEDVVFGNSSWILNRELYIQTAGERALYPGSQWNYEFESMPPHLPEPLNDAYTFGTAIKFVWQDAGLPLGVSNNIKVTTQFIG